MCPTLSFLCVRPLRPSREQTAYIWTHFTPPAWPIFWLPLFFLPTSVEVFSLSRPTGSRLTIPSQSLFYGNRIQYTSQLYYKNVWFSSFLKLSFYHLWPCCLRYINSNLEKKINPLQLCSTQAHRLKLSVFHGFKADFCKLTVFWDWIQYATGQNQTQSHYYALRSSKNLPQLIFQFTLQEGGCNAAACCQSLSHLDAVQKSSVGLLPVVHCPKIIW